MLLNTGEKILQTAQPSESSCKAICTTSLRNTTKQVDAPKYQYLIPLLTLTLRKKWNASYSKYGKNGSTTAINKTL